MIVDTREESWRTKQCTLELEMKRLCVCNLRKLVFLLFLLSSTMTDDNTVSFDWEWPWNKNEWSKCSKVIVSGIIDNIDSIKRHDTWILKHFWNKCFFCFTWNLHVCAVFYWDRTDVGYAKSSFFSFIAIICFDVFSLCIAEVVMISRQCSVDYVTCWRFSPRLLENGRCEITEGR